MPTVIKDARTFTADRPWGARHLLSVEGATARLHWTDQSYRWHVNDGAELFVVIAGEVDMHFKKDGETQVIRLCAGDMFAAAVGDEHMARPIGEARVLVIEKAGSI